MDLNLEKPEPAPTLSLPDGVDDVLLTALAEIRPFVTAVDEDESDATPEIAIAVRTTLSMSMEGFGAVVALVDVVTVDALLELMSR
jgi:hypothetical protein